MPLFYRDSGDTERESAGERDRARRGGDRIIEIERGVIGLGEDGFEEG